MKFIIIKRLCSGFAGDMTAMSKTIDMTKGKTHTTHGPSICIYRTRHKNTLLYIRHNYEYETKFVHLYLCTVIH
jgi:hypothetical protein